MNTNKGKLLWTFDFFFFFNACLALLSKCNPISFDPLDRSEHTLQLLCLYSIALSAVTGLNEINNGNE